MRSPLVYRMFATALFSLLINGGMQVSGWGPALLNQGLWVVKPQYLDL